FSNIFLNKQYKIYKVETWLVTDVFSKMNLTDLQFEKKIKSSALDYFSSMKPLRINGIITIIQIKNNLEEICT
ncbi:MAG: hypothetical protein D3924_06070, partial [Candidatus Electrothrix sp. AR4]|nr:hypothetical protein [Candidatus Electrothrix sp. AR4]